MVNGIVFDLQNVTAADLAHTFWIICGMRDCITSGCGMTYSGRNVYLTAGYFFARGHLVKLTGTTEVEGPTVTSGQLYCHLVFEIDLSQTPSEEEFTQGKFKILSSATGYPTATKEDLDNNGSVYQMSFAKFIMTNTGISGFVANGEFFDTWAEVELKASGWSSTYPWTQSVDIATMTADKEPLYKMAIPDNVTESQGADLKDAYGCIDDVKTTDTGIIVKCIGDKPTMDMSLRLRGL